MIKEAVTAVSFGARAKGIGWAAQDGGWTNPALVNIIKNGVQRAAFLNSAVIRQFIREQGMLDNFLAAVLKTAAPMLYFGPLITRNVIPSKSRAVAYLYQHAEAQIMQSAIDVLVQYGVKPIALIHDAFVVRHKLSASQRDEIHQSLRSSTQNKFWVIKSTQLKGYRYQ